jgi:hypothetical protein
MITKIKLIAIIITALLGTGVVSQLIPYFSSNTPIYPIEDAYVYQYEPSKNFGTTSPLKVGSEMVGTTGPAYTYRSYLKFDLSTYSTQSISSSKLYMYWSGAMLPAVEYIPFDKVYIALVSDAWTETGVTWNNKPPWGSEKQLDLSTKWSEGIFTPGWSTIDITDWVKSQFSVKDYIISVGVYSIYEGSLSLAWFHSREGSNKPYLEITTEVAPPTPTFTLLLTVKDQLGNPLPATVTVDKETKTCDAYGKASFNVTQNVLATVTAKIKVGARTYESSTAIFMDKDKTGTVTITRRFLWQFDLKYTDETRPDGTLATINKEALTIPITAGKGEAYLLDGTYTLTFTASPQVNLGKITVNNDQIFTATIDKQTGQVTTGIQTPVVTPQPVEIPWVLLPTTHIYILTGVILIVGIVAIYYRRKTILPQTPKRW